MSLPGLVCLNVSAKKGISIETAFEEHSIQQSDLSGIAYIPQSHFPPSNGNDKLGGIYKVPRAP